MIFQKFGFFKKKDRHKKTWDIYGLLGNKFNSDFLTVRLVKNHVDKKIYQVTTKSMYESTKVRFGQTHCQIGEWPKSTAYKNLIYNEFGDKSELDSFYYPVDLIDLDQEFLKRLGPPVKMHDGILLTSGRSFLVTPEGAKAFILKIGTHRYSKLKNFSMRFLTVRNILNCIQITGLAKKHHAIFEEASGGVIYTKINTKLTAQDELTYLIRSLDLEQNEFSKDTILLPLTAVLSNQFWKASELLKSLNLQVAKNELLFTSLAEKFAESISKSLTESHLHFMSHQQNLTIAVENGEATSLIYSDLQDTLVDAIGLLLNRLVTAGSLEDIGGIYGELFDTVKMSDSNLNNQMLYPGGVTSGYDVLSYYLRFYKYLSQYEQYFARLSPVKDLFGTMAAQIYNDSRLDSVRSQISDDDNLSANRKNLFWLIDKTHYLLESQNIRKLQQQLNFSSLQALTPDEVYFILSISRTACSRDFPKHLIDVDPKKITAAYDLYQKNVLFVVYDGKPCVLVGFRGVAF